MRELIEIDGVTGEVADGERGAGDGRDADVVAEAEVGDGGRRRGVALDHWELRLVQEDPHRCGKLKPRDYCVATMVTVDGNLD